MNHKTFLNNKQPPRTKIYNKSKISKFLEKGINIKQNFVNTCNSTKNANMGNHVILLIVKRNLDRRRT